MIATARILMPASYVRLSAGRVEMTDEAQALCFFAGANSIFAGEKLLTQKNNGESRDRALMEKLGMRFKEGPASVYLCGAPDIVKILKDSCLAEWKIPKEDVHVESFV